MRRMELLIKDKGSPSAGARRAPTPQSPHSPSSALPPRKQFQFLGSSALHRAVDGTAAHPPQSRFHLNANSKRFSPL